MKENKVKSAYAKPAMRVVGLRQRTRLLAGSTMGAKLGSYSMNSDDVWTDDGSSSTTGGGSIGGWTDTGADAWE